MRAGLAVAQVMFVASAAAVERWGELWIGGPPTLTNLPHELVGVLAYAWRAWLISGAVPPERGEEDLRIAAVTERQ